MKESFELSFRLGYKLPGESFFSLEEFCQSVVRRERSDEGVVVVVVVREEEEEEEDGVSDEWTDDERRRRRRRWLGMAAFVR